MYFATVDKENQYDIYSSYFTSFLKYLLFKKQLFLVHKLGKWETAFGLKCNNLSLKFGVFNLE